MTNALFAFLIITIVSIPALSVAANTPYEEQAGKFVCEFGQGSRFEYAGSSFTKKDDKFSSPTVIENINMKNKTAAVIGNNGTAKAAVYINMNGFNFIKINEGETVVITIYTNSPVSKSKFPAYMSSNYNLLGYPIANQVAGFCIYK